MSPKLSRVVRIASLVLACMAVLLYAGYFAVYLVYAADLFQWPFDYDQGEGFELYDAILYSRGEWPYRDNATYPFYASNYPPLFHLLVVPLLSVFGPQVVAGRIVSFAATLITAGTIAVVVRRRVGGWFLPAVSGLGFLASNYVYQIGPLSRMHMTMVMFETLAIAFIGEFDHPRHGQRNLLLGLLMLLCAGYTKQMAVFTAAAALGYIFLRDVRKALVSGVALALVAGVIFWLINVATDGQWWINSIQANVNEFDYRQTVFLFGQWFRLHTLFVVLAAGYLVYELFWDRLSAYSLWFFFALGAGALSGKWGAGFGYFTTAVAAACLASGLALGRLGQTVERLAESGAPGEVSPADARHASRLANALRPLQSIRKRLGAWAPATLAILVPLLYVWQAPRMLHLPTSGSIFGPLAQALGVEDRLIQGDCATFQYHDAMGYTQLGHLMTPADYVAGQQILDYVRTADGTPFSEEAMFNLLAGEPVITNPTQLLNLHKKGLLDTSDLVARINSQEFGVVVFRAQFYPHPVLEAIGQNYQPVEHLCMNGFYYHVLWPRRKLVEQPVQVVE
jgi:hypothetical protein